MAELKKISELPDVEALKDSALFPAVQDGVTINTTVEQLRAAMFAQKPFGTYVRDIDGYREVDIGGNGYILLIQSVNGVALATITGCICLANGVISTLSATECIYNYTNGKLQIATESPFVNAADVDYYYQLL